MSSDAPRDPAREGWAPVARPDADPRGLRGHVIICGLAGVGLRTVEQLFLAGVAVVVIDDNADTRLQSLVQGWGIPRVTGSSRVRGTLEAAGLARAAAVVCVQETELHALEAALLVHRLRPGVRLVVALANPSVGKALGDLSDTARVLDVADLSAPSVVEACIGRRSHPLPLEGADFVTAELAVREAGTLRERFGDLAPIAVVPAGGEAGPGEMVVCPGRDHRVEVGDRVTVVGAPAEVAKHPPARPDSTVPRVVPAERAGRWRRRLGLPARLGRAVLREADRPVRTALLALLALSATSVAVLLSGYRKPDGRHMSPLDAVYFTIETIATIGYGDFSFAEQDAWLRGFAIALMICGASLAAILFALLTNMLVTRRIAESLGRRDVSRMTNHVVVVGLGSVGVRVVEGLLAEGRRVVVLDRDEDNRYLASARALGVPVVIGDATLRETMRAVGLHNAAAVAVMTSDDLVNIETGLAAREQLAGRWPGVPVVVRIFDTQLGETIAESFGFGQVRSTAALAAPWFTGAALGLSVLGTFYVESQPFLVARLTVAAAGGLNGLAMQELSARTRVVAIRRAADAGRLEHPPRSGTRFAAGDQAYLVGPYSELLQVLRTDALSTGLLPDDGPAVQG